MAENMGIESDQPLYISSDVLDIVLYSICL